MISALELLQQLLLQHRVKSRRPDRDGHGVALTRIPRVFSTAHAFLIDALVFPADPESVSQFHAFDSLVSWRLAHCMDEPADEQSPERGELDVAKLVCVRRNEKSYVRWAFVSHCRLRSVCHTDIPRGSCTRLNHMVTSVNNFCGHGTILLSLMLKPPYGYHCDIV